MKTYAKVLSSLLALLMLFCVIPQTAAFAVNDGQTGAEQTAAAQDGITLSVETDKDSYASGEEINVTVTVKNTNDYVINNATVTVELPEGLSLVSGDLSISGLTLQPGDTYRTSVKAMKSEPTAPTEPTVPTEPPVPTVPTVPTEPTQPTEPTEPTEPTKPTWPSIPTDPTEPTTPTEPTKTTEPTAVTKPTAPTEPTEPTTPPTKKHANPTHSKDSDAKDKGNSHQDIPKTGEMSTTPFVIIMILTPIIAAAALLAVKKYKYFSKRAICLVLILSLAFSIMPIHVFAADADTAEVSLSAEKTVTIDGKEYVIKTAMTGEYKKTVQEYTYREKEDGTVALTGYNGSASALTIPASIDGKKVSEIGDSAFAGLLCLKTVRIPEGVTHIDNYAFECCSLLQKIYFPASLKSIGDGAFSDCGSLTLADMQDGVKSIGNGAFLCCDSLVQLELSEALTKVGDFAFSGCAALASIRFNGDGVTALPDRVFYGCTSLSRVYLPDKITSIGKRAFAHCEKIESLYFGEPLTSLGAYAFQDCSKLSSLTVTSKVIPTGTFSGCNSLTWFSVQDGTVRIEQGAFGSSGITDVGIPASVTEIEPGAFFQVRGSLTLDEENTNYQLIDGSLYTADGKTLLAFFPADPYAEEPQTEFTVPDGVETIAAYALAESQLTTVILPSSVKRIDAYAFMDLNAENVVIPEGATVDPAAFGDSQQEEDGSSDDSGEGKVPLEVGSVAGDKNLFREEDYAGYRQIANDEFNAWCEKYLAYNQAQGIPLSDETIPYIMRYKGEVIPHYMPMTAVQNHDPAMWAEAASVFGDDFEQTYLMMNHGLFTELDRGKMEEPLVLYSGLYDSQLMAAAGTDVVPTQQQLVDAIGNTFTDPIMISTTTDPGIAAGFGDTLFIIYASKDAMESLGAVCIDAVAHSQEKEILMNANARYRILDVGNMAIEQQEPWDPEPRTLYRHYVKVELLTQ